MSAEREQAILRMVGLQKGQLAPADERHVLRTYALDLLVQNVRDMREAQRRYTTKRTQDNLAAAKQAEREVDARLAEYDALVERTQGGEA